eukprot:scaffold36658_cov61-Attheya_sp.AAC.2
MAPREATGAFADQYLSFDYDASGPIVMTQQPQQAQQQTQTPAEPGTGVFSESDDHAFAQALDTANTITMGPLGGEDSEDSDDTGNHGSSPHVAASRPLPSSQQPPQPPVDPLSIDPTLHSSPWEHTIIPLERHPSSRPRHGGRHNSAVTTVNPPTVVSTYHNTNGLPGASVESAFPVTRVNSLESQQSNGDLSANLSTGSSALAAGGSPPTTTRRRPTLPSRIVSFSSVGSIGSESVVATTAAAVTPVNLPTLVGSSSHRRFESSGTFTSVIDSSTSILDISTSIDSDDDEDDDEDEDDSQAMPDLDTTNVSMTVPQEEDEEDEGNESVFLPAAVSPLPIASNLSSSPSSAISLSSSHSSGSMMRLHRNRAFDLSNETGTSTPPPQAQRHAETVSPPGSPILLSFGPNTTVSDLKYFAERGCIVALLAALRTPRLKTLGTRMLADYAKMPNRRVAVASNRRILEFLQHTMLDCSASSEPGVGYSSPEWLGREYAVETVRSLTATEESDRYLMASSGLLKTLALVARGGPFISHPEQRSGGQIRSRTVGLATGKARLHACIAVMNLSCGKANKIEIAKIPDVLEAMRDVMVGAHFSSSSVNTRDEARLKATTCVKNLSNADANDAALLGTPGLVEALGHVAEASCSIESGATSCTTNACLALMNLSISKSNKHRVFRTPGIMEALVAVITRTSPSGSRRNSNTNNEARIKACSALSNLAIGYDNKIPMFAYPGFVDAILLVIDTDSGEARTKACSILWSFAAEMKNQVPVVRRGDILPTLVRVAEEDGRTEARFKCVAALTLLAESLENAIPLLESGALAPLMDILHDAGPDPTQWKGQTASWCVGFLMNMAQSDEAVPSLREAGVVELLAPLLTLDHYQSLKAAMAVTFVCRYDEGDETYDLLRKTENVIPKIISLLHNTLSGRGGNGYKYGVFTLRSSVGCIASLASGPEFMKERIATRPVFESLLRVVTDFCVDRGTTGAIVGGGRDDALSATLAIRALQALTGHLIPIPGSSNLPFGPVMEDRLLTALESFESSCHAE